MKKIKVTVVFIAPGSLFLSACSKDAMEGLPGTRKTTYGGISTFKEDDI